MMVYRNPPQPCWCLGLHRGGLRGSSRGTACNSLLRHEITTVRKLRAALNRDVGLRWLTGPKTDAAIRFVASKGIEPTYRGASPPNLHRQPRGWGEPR